MDDLIRYVEDFIESRVRWPKAVKIDRQNRIIANLIAVENELGKDFDYKKAFAAINFESQVFMHQLLGEFEQRTTAELAGHLIVSISMQPSTE